MKLDQFIEYNIKIIFLEKLYEKPIYWVGWGVGGGGVGCLKGRWWGRGAWRKTFEEKYFQRYLLLTNFTA